MPDNAPVCRRCGRCCELGGPGLLRDDAPLLSSGALKPEMLVCLRRGQWARQDGMGGGLAQLENEMIKLAGTGKAPHPWQCLAYAPGTGCTIYERRPVQCGVLFCEDTRPLEALLRDVPALDRVRVELNRIGVNMNQIARARNRRLSGMGMPFPSSDLTAASVRLSPMPTKRVVSGVKRWSSKTVSGKFCP